MHLHQALAQTLRSLDVSTVFGVLGEGNLPLVDAYRRTDGGTYVAAAHEAGAVLMAHGYAQARRDVGVATVTHGPGLTNTVTGLVEAARTRTPLVLIAGEVAPDDPSNAQAIDQVRILEGTGVGVVRGTSVRDALPALRQAFQQALAEHRPVTYMLPVNLLWQPVELSGRVHMRAHSREAGEWVADENALDHALGVFASARRPLVLAGHGAATQKGREALIALAHARGARLATTLRAKDLFRGVPGDVGICGSYATTIGAEAISHSDCVMAFGASLNDYTTMSGTLFEGKSVVQVDIHPAAIGAHHRVEGGVVGDVSEVAAVMTRLLVEADVPPSGYDTTKPEAPNEERWAPVPAAGLLDAHLVAAEIERTMPTDRLLAVDAGRFLHLVYRMFSNPPVAGLVHGLGFGVIGIGMAHAIGAWFARPERPVLHVTGDGGFMLGGLTELHTAVRHRVDVVVVVINDSSYGAEHIQLRRRELPVDVSMMAWPDLARVASSLGLDALVVSRPEDVARIGPFIANRSGPALIDVRVDPDQLNSLVP